ncbi:MAG TPA: YeeE/YedE thiosulfate transporter family protein [Gemmatimonadales bacterium]
MIGAEAAAEASAVPSVSRRARPYRNPYHAGIGLGLVLLLAFVIMGRGLGASGAFSTVVAVGVGQAAPQRAAANPAFAQYLDGTEHPLKDWLLFEILGVTVGGALSGLFAGRIKRVVEKGPRVSARGRLLYAFGGGAIMGLGAKLARGCTSGQMLTGGALLSVGSWLFIVTAFAAAYLAAPLFRKQWT